MKTKLLFCQLLFVLFLLSAGKVSMAAVPAMPSMIYVYGGTAKVCPGETRYYYVTYVAGLSYTWTAPTGVTITGGQGTDSIAVSITAGFTATGTLSVYATNSSGNSSPRTYSMVRNNPSTPGYVTGTLSAACAGSSHVYTVPAVAGVNYSWTTNVATVSYPSGQGTNTVTASFNATFTTGNLMVNGYNGCGTSGTRTQAIMSVPAKPSMITGPGYGVCGLSGLTYSFPVVANATSYSWTSTSGGTFTGATNSNSAIVNFGSAATVTLSATSINACGSSVARTMTVNTKSSTPPVLYGNTFACIGGIDTYFVTPLYGATSYTWVIPAGATFVGSSSGSTVFVHWGTTAGVVKVKANNACGSSGYRSITVTIMCRDAGNTIVDNNFSIYPNPAFDNVSISATGLIDGNYSVMLSNLLGQTLNKQETTCINGGIQMQLNLTDLTSGIYFVSVQSATMKKTFKIEKN